MKDKALTLEQQAFAKEHHGLVYKYLSKNKLPKIEFYDIVIFGYLKAVTEYLARSALREKYKFGTIAFRKMSDSVYEHFIYKNRQKRKATVLSLDAPAYSDRDDISLHETLSSPDDGFMDLDIELMLLEIVSKVSKKEMNILHMKKNGFSTREIAKAHKISMQDVCKTLARLRETVLAICYERS